MADLKISQLPAAAALTGSELIELVQSGGNVKSTAAAVAGSSPATPASVLSPVSTELWVFGVANGNSGTFPVMTGPGAGITGQLNLGANGAGASGRSGTPSSGSMYLGIGSLFLPQTGGSLNSACEVTFNPMAAAMNSFRKASGGLPIAGFTFVFVGGLDTTRADQTAFFGLGANSLFGGSAVISNQLNIVGFGKDQGDTNLQFMVNNGAGAAAKTDTGLTFTSLIRHLFKITITCDPLGALITATIQDLEVTSPFPTKTFTVADGAAKNPVADARIVPHMYIGTGASTSTVCVMGWSSLFIQSSLAGNA